MVFNCGLSYRTENEKFLDLLQDYKVEEESEDEETDDILKGLDDDDDKD